MEYKANKILILFIKAFQNRLHRTPDEYIDEKLATGSKFEDIKYLFNVVAAEISLQNNCKYFDFDYFYNRNSNHIKTTQSNSHKSAARPQNAGKLWTAEEEQLLIKLYNSGATKAEMCERFGRTEKGLAAESQRQKTGNEVCFATCYTVLTAEESCGSILSTTRPIYLSFHAVIITACEELAVQLII